MQTIVHYTLHLGFPLIIALIFFRDRWQWAWLILMLTMIVDLDHFAATPFFDPNRCSIGFHPLHSWIAIGIYFILLFFRQTRIIAVGLLFHMFTDLVDCLWTFARCQEC
ncbi:MAG: DUF6122 family protein, partial [bacterium]